LADKVRQRSEKVVSYQECCPWSKLAAGNSAQRTVVKVWAGNDKDQMLENNSTNVSGSRAEHERLFRTGPPEINLRFGARLSALRTQKELSQEELALRLLVPVSHLMDLEAGRKSASIIDLDDLAQEFRISIADLLLGL
jgi:ribosome-binding protein aMBF1 (putative translation factor)